MGLLSNTFAIDSSSDNYVFDTNNSINLSSGEARTIIYKINNTNNGKVQYGIGYKGDNISVKLYEDSFDSASGVIEQNQNKFVKLYITNTGSTSSSVSLITILGYENGGNLVVPDGYLLVNDKYIGVLSDYIKGLYNNSNKTSVTNNEINYYTSLEYQLINDRNGGTSSLMDDGNIRYYGADPNNYIYFNCSDYANQSSSTCSKWRIIGVFDEKVKIISEIIPYNLSWDNKNISTGAEVADGKNDWNNARLMKVLNPSNYFTVDNNDNNLGQSLYYNGGSGSCFMGNNNATISCNFNTVGIKNDTTRSLIAENTWNLGGYTSSSQYVNSLYVSERGTNVYSGRSTVWTGKVALMYMSDYGYAADLNKCNKMLINYDDSSCTSNNWLYKSSTYFWVLSPNSSASDIVWGISSTGRSGSGGYVCSNTISVRPTLYLNSDIEVKTGDGSSNNPYQIQVD